MRTTENLGRWGGARCEQDEVEMSTLARARRLFADLSCSLEGEIDRLQAARDDETDGGRIRDLADLIRQNQKALQTVLDQEAKLDRRAEGSRRGEGVIDLAEARAEIARRLARLAG